MKSFKLPTFESGDLELRFDEGEVMLYGTPRGMARLAELCMKLAQIPNAEVTKHYHLEDYDLLTGKSLRGTLAVFQHPPETT